MVMEPRVIKLGQYSPSENGWVLSADGIAHCVAGGGHGHDTDIPKILIRHGNPIKF